MDFAGRWHDKTCDEKTAADDNKEHGGDELNGRAMFANFHCKMLCMWRIIVNFAYQDTLNQTN